MATCRDSGNCRVPAARFFRQQSTVSTEQQGDWNSALLFATRAADINGTLFL